ncbi:MAG: hypothetical protein AAFV74_23050 [Pseudomonadota bacterium]
MKDEILNSMQAQSRLVPLLADLLNWGAKTMPPAIANPSPSPGVSPGPLAISGVEAAPKWQALPILFTLNNQTVGPPLGPLGHILGIASTSRTVHAFLDETVEYLFDRLSEGEFLEYGELTSLGTRVFQNRAAFAEALPGVLNAALHGAPVPTVNIGNTDYINNTVEPFLNGILADMVTLLKIMLFSGEYHTFIPCAFTFLLDPP